MILLFALYTYLGFTVFKNHTEEEKKSIFKKQNSYMFLIHFNAYMVLYLKTSNLELLIYYGAQVVFLAGTILLYKVIYPKVSRLVVNNMCMLITIGFIILTRLSYDKSKRQFEILVISMVITIFIPFLISKMGFLKKLHWLYAIAGISLLCVVAVAGSVSYGAKLSFSFGGISLQPSEFVKIIFVFFAASRLNKSIEFRDNVITTLVAVIHVLVLVLSKDLGSALIFFVVYVTMLYVATKKPVYLFAGLLSGTVAAVIAYQLFNHVRVRVIAWSNPFSVIDNEGYQIAQSLFAIGTGGWFGMGLFQGSPNSIPVVEQDFVFSAISEELGAIFALCLILVCVSCYIMFLNIALQIHDLFYKLVALGLGTVYIFQVFLTIGGAIKFIPSTGVTLPLVSYGGSSVLSTLIMFAIIQGLYILRQDEDDILEKA